MKPYAVFFVLIALALAQDPTPTPDQGALPSSTTNGVDPVTVPTPVDTIYGYITSSDQHQILSAIMDTLSNTSTSFQSPGARFTVFAPADFAFRDLARRITNEQDPPTTKQVLQQLSTAIESIKKGPDFVSITGIFWYHVLNGVYNFAQLEDFGTINTAIGQNVSFIDGRVRDLDPSRQDANAFQKNIFNQNGWVHSIDSVLLPFDLETAIRVSLASPSPSPTATPSLGAATAPPTTSGQVPDASPVSPAVSPTAAATTEEPDASPEDDDPICFPSTARVHTLHGSVAMEQLEAGQEVLHHESGQSSKVFLFTHRTNAYAGWYYRITTSTGHAVTMTGNHYLYVNDRLTAADAVIIGDVLRTVAGPSPVVKVERIKGTGLYAPHSVHGDLVVDGIVVSGYSRAVRPGVAHAVLAPVRWLVKMTGIREPFGGLLYEGGRGIEKYLPKGKTRY